MDFDFWGFFCIICVFLSEFVYNNDKFEIKGCYSFICRFRDKFNRIVLKNRSNDKDMINVFIFFIIKGRN